MKNARNATSRRSRTALRIARRERSRKSSSRARPSSIEAARQPRATEDARALREPAAERNVDAGSDQLDGGALLEEVNGERRRLGEAALEPLGIAAPGPLEHEPGVEPRVGLELAHHQRGGLGARAPMDEPGVVAEPILAQIVEAMPAAPTRRGGAAGAGELTAPVGRDRAHGRVDENLRARRELRRLDEQAEREPRGDLEARDPPAPPRPWGLLPRDEPRAAPFELREIRAMPSAQDLDGDRVGGAPALAVDHPGRDERGLSGEELGGQGGLDAHSTDRLLGEHPRHDDQAEQHRDEEIEEIVPGVDGGESEAERGAEAPPAVARGPERASRPREPPPDPTPRCHAGVTGDGSPGGG